MKTRSLIVIASLVGGMAVAAPTPPPRNPEQLIRQGRERIENVHKAADALDKAGMKEPAAKLHQQAEKMQQEMQARIRQFRERQAASPSPQAKDARRPQPPVRSQMRDKPAQPPVRGRMRGQPAQPPVRGRMRGKPAQPPVRGRMRGKPGQPPVGGQMRGQPGKTPACPQMRGKPGQPPVRGEMRGQPGKTPVPPEMLRRAAQIEKQIGELSQRVDRLERAFRASQAKGKVKTKKDAKSAPKAAKKAPRAKPAAKPKAPRKGRRHHRS